MSLVSDQPLHCLCSAPRSQAGLRLLAHLEPKDTVLLLGKAVILAGASHPDIQEWIDAGVQLHALDEDLQAYAVTELHPSVVATDYADWVRLSESHQTQVLWR